MKIGEKSDLEDLLIDDDDIFNSDMGESNDVVKFARKGPSR